VMYLDSVGERKIGDERRCFFLGGEVAGKEGSDVMSMEVLRLNTIVGQMGKPSRERNS